jgi:hypothetical protein
LTVSEEDYFTFSRHMDKIIPSYLVAAFADRGLFFLGYAPTHWEDRLIVNAILNKRNPQAEPPYAITTDADQFVQAYWEFQKVHSRAIRLKDFVQKLAASV